MLQGIDVHDKNGAVDWKGVAAEGKAYAFVRGAYGDAQDTRVSQNYSGAKAAGLTCGVYHFYRVTKDPKAQADLMVKTLRHVKFGPGDLLPVIDVEDNPQFDGPWDTKNNAAMIAGVQNWIAQIKQQFNCPPIVYTRASFWKILGNPAGFNVHPLWVAHYQKNGKPTTPALPNGWKTYAFWQYSDSGNCAGTACDLNAFNGDAKGLKALTLPVPAASLTS